MSHVDGTRPEQASTSMWSRTRARLGQDWYTTILAATAPFELTGTGEITDETVHLHVVLGREGDTALAGHLR